MFSYVQWNHPGRSHITVHYFSNDFLYCFHNYLFDYIYVNVIYKMFNNYLYKYPYCHLELSFIPLI